MPEEQHHRPWQLKFHFHHKDHPKTAKDPARKTSISDHGAISQRKPPTGQTLRLDFTQNIPLNLPYPPFINVEGVPNFRDIGGFACTPPSAPQAFPNTALHVRQGLVYRCSELSQLTPAGNVTMVEFLRIKTLYDFRSEAEAANPRGHPQGVACISVPVFTKKDVTYTMSVQQLQWSTSADKPKGCGYSQGYVNWYRQIAEYGAKSAFRVCFQHIRDKPDEPFVYHCSAGKDRTGVFSALVLKLCGVDDQAVAWEYSLTVPGMGVWESMVEQEMIGDSMMPIRSHGGMTAEEAARVCGSRASNMARWLDVVLREEFGGVEKYMVDHCGFTVEDVERIRNNLLVPGEGTVKVVELPESDMHPQT